MGGDPTAFQSTEAKAVAKGAERLAKTPTPAPPLTIGDLRIISHALQYEPEGLPIRAALLIGFYGFLRASNILSPSASTWGGPHTLTRADVIDHGQGLVLVVRSTKTRSTTNSPTVLSLPIVSDPLLCPTTAWRNYVAVHPAPLHYPAFRSTNGQPLTAAPIVAAMRRALAAANNPHAPTVSMHSMRRGGAQAAQAAGCSREDIAAHGTWASESGLAAYIPPDSSSRVANALATSIGP